MLSFEQAPPLSATFRFFLTAPWFGVAAGLLLAWDGQAALASRWTPAALALTHLLTAGFMLQAMCGALLQFIPVATGGNVWRPRLVANLAHPALLVGALLLSIALAAGRWELLPASELLLGGGLGVFCAATGSALARAGTASVSVAALRVAIVGLAVTALLGLALAQTLSGRLELPLPALANLHAAWGLGGWALTLLAGVSFTVVPMFQMTPPYPSWVRRWIPAALGAALTAAAAVALGQGWPWRLTIGLALLSAIGFALATLRLQQRRRRARLDASFAFSRGAMVSLVAAGACGLASLLLQDPVAPWLPACIGVLCLVGVFVSAISGMLYKIVPFIGWLKLSERGDARSPPASIRSFISDRAMSAHMRWHFAALALLLACLALPWLARPAGLAFAASCAWLGVNLVRAVRRYSAFTGR